MFEHSMGLTHFLQGLCSEPGQFSGMHTMNMGTPCRSPNRRRNEKGINSSAMSEHCPHLSWLTNLTATASESAHGLLTIQIAMSYGNNDKCRCKQGQHSVIVQARNRQSQHTRGAAVAY